MLNCGRVREGASWLGPLSSLKAACYRVWESSCWLHRWHSDAESSSEPVGCLIALWVQRAREWVGDCPKLKLKLPWGVRRCHLHHCERSAVWLDAVSEHDPIDSSVVMSDETWMSSLERFVVVLRASTEESDVELPPSAVLERRVNSWVNAHLRDRMFSRSQELACNWTEKHKGGGRWRRRLPESAALKTSHSLQRKPRQIPAACESVLLCHAQCKLPHQSRRRTTRSPTTFHISLRIRGMRFTLASPESRITFFDSAI